MNSHKRVIRINPPLLAWSVLDHYTVHSLVLQFNFTPILTVLEIIQMVYKFIWTAFPTVINSLYIALDHNVYHM